MNQHRVIVIGASSGGVEALKDLFSGFEPDINAAVFVVLHLLPGSRSLLPEILGLRSKIPVAHAEDRMRIRPGRAYIAPPDQHLIIEDGSLRLTFDPKVNHTRPAIDPLFESAARWYGPNTIGVVLSGNLYDGTKGLLTIKQAGGIAVVQDPSDALQPSMPESALQYVPVDYTLPVMEIPLILNRLASEPVFRKGGNQVDQRIPESSNEESEFIEQDIESFETAKGSMQRSVLTCPDCGGVLWEIKDGQLMRYRCHTGHIYNAEILLASHDSDLEKAFWTAIRTLVEKAAVSNRLALRAMEQNNQQLEKHYLSVAKEAEEKAKLIRETWFGIQGKRSPDISPGEKANEDVTRSTDD